MDVRPTRLLTRLSGTPRLVLAVLLLVAGAVGVLATGAPPVTAAVTVAVHAVGAGEVVGADAVRTEHRPRSEVPDGTLTPAQVVGRRLVSAVSRGEVLTAARVAGVAWRLEPATAVVAVSVAPATAGVVSPGDLVDVVVAGGAADGTGADAPGAGTEDADIPGAGAGDVDTTGAGAGSAGTTDGDGTPGTDPGTDGTAPDGSGPTLLAHGARVLAVWPGEQGSDRATIVLQVEGDLAPRIAVLPPQALVGVVTAGT